MSPSGRPRGGLARAIAVTSVAALAFGVPTAAAASPDRHAHGGSYGHHRPAFTLTILHNNDSESQILGTAGDVDGDGTVGNDEERAYGNVARFATVVEQQRQKAIRGRLPEGYAGKRAALVLSAGDNVLAGPEWAASLDHGVPYYDALTMAHLRYDASTLGNHEFDFGPEVTAKFIRSTQGKVPFVSANLDFSGEPKLAALVDDGILSDRTIVRKKGERIGIIGLTTPALRSVSSPRNVEIRDELARITNNQVAALESKGVDKIVLVSHLQDIDNERQLVHKLDDVDAVVGGGGGELLAGPEDRLIPGDEPDYPYPIVSTDSDGTRVPVVTTPGEYEYVGKLVLHFDRDGHVVGWDKKASGAVRVSSVGPDAVRPDPWVSGHVVEPVRGYVQELDQTVVAQTEVALDGIREHVRSRETNLGDLLADALRWEATQQWETTQQADEYGLPEAQVAVENGGGMRSDSIIPPGPVTALDTYDVAPFPNFVVTVPKVPPETFKKLLERNVAAAPDTAGQFAQVSGFSFTYDTSKQAQRVDETTCEITRPGERVQHVELADGTVVVDGGKVVSDQPISLATNDFSARGGDCWPLGELDFTAVGKTYQQALEEYLREGLGRTVTAEQYPKGGAGRINEAS